MKNTGISLVSLIGIIFIVLKLAHIGDVANWSWFWVLCPFWIGIAFFGFFVILFLAFSLFSAALPVKKNSNKKS